MESLSLETIHERLQAGLGLKGGSRGSLTRCVGRLGQAKAAALADDGDTNAAAATAMTDSLIREIEFMHLEMTKLVLMAQRQRAELEEMPTLPSSNTHDTEKVTQARQAVQLLRHQRAVAHATLACQREYESLAKVACSRYPTPRRVLQQKLDTLLASRKQAAAELHTIQAQIAVREKQVAALLQCLSDLQQSLQEPLVLTPAEETDTPMQVDDNEKDQQNYDAMEPDEDGALYDDL